MEILNKKSEKMKKTNVHSIKLNSEQWDEKMKTNVNLERPCIEHFGTKK